MNLIRSHLPPTAVLLVLSVSLPILAQIPEVPPPTVDWEGTYESWDITHPGWREWYNKPPQEPEAPAPPPPAKPAPPQATQAAKPAQPPPPAIDERKKKEEEERWRQLQLAWQQQAQQQQQAAERQRAFEQAKQLLLASFQMPPDTAAPAVAASLAGAGDTRDAPAPLAYTTSLGSFASSLPVGKTGLSPGEWQRARQYQDLIESVARSSDAAPEDRSILEMAEVRRNQLWSKAVSVPGLPDDDREALALSLPATTATECSGLTLQDARALQNAIQSAGPRPDTVLATMLSDLYVAKGTDAAAQLGQAFVERGLAKDAAGRFGAFLAAGKIAVAAVKDGPASGIAATVDVIVGTIPIPQATLAIEGGRQYANVVFQAQSKFMVDAMKVVGVDFDVQQFWRQFKQELSTGQKAVMEFVSYGPQN